MTHFGTLFGALLADLGQIRGSVWDPNNGEMRDLGYFGVSGSRRPRCPKWAKLGYFGGTSEVLRKYFEVLISTFWSGVHFGTTFGPLLEDSGSKYGVQIRTKQRENEGFRVFRPLGYSETSRPRNGSKRGPK